MTRHLGHRAIARACGVSSDTALSWCKAARHGKAAPVRLHWTIHGRPWVSEEDVDHYWTGGGSVYALAPQEIQQAAGARLRRLGLL